jgi:hypothetical protein
MVFRRSESDCCEPSGFEHLFDARVGVGQLAKTSTYSAYLRVIRPTVLPDLELPLNSHS